MAAHHTNGSLDSPAPLRKGSRRIDGQYWPDAVTGKCLAALKAYDVWEDDVWVTTYPKSGSHWAVEIVNLIVADGHEKEIDRRQQPPPAEFDFTAANSVWLSSGPGRRPRKAVPQHEEMLTWKAPRVIMTHLPEECMPAQIYQGKGKVIYVIRNPKDIAVSKWHFWKVKYFDGRNGDWDSFLRDYMAGTATYGTWFAHVLGFWTKHRHDRNFLFLMYEDMKEDLKGAIIEIADFLGRPLSEDALKRVVELSSMESMKRRFHVNSQETCGDPNVDTRAPSHGAGKTFAVGAKLGPPGTMRKGIVGDWRSRFTVAQSEAFDELFQTEMKGSRLKIQFQ